MSDIIKNELTKIKTNNLGDDFPVWEDYSLLQPQNNDERLDNNYFSNTYELALRYLQTLEDSSIVEVKTFDEIILSYTAGTEPEKNGDCPLIEKTNLLPNTILTSFEKFATFDTNKKFHIKLNDILLSKDGSPGVACCVTQRLLDILQKKLGYEGGVIGTHVYRIELKTEFQKYASFLTLFLNSKLGQAIVRRYISGSVSPTIGSQTIKRMLICIPIKNSKKLIDDSIQYLNLLQNEIFSTTKRVDYSNDLVKELAKDGNLEPPVISRLQINWNHGGKRDLHGYYKDWR